MLIGLDFDNTLAGYDSLFQQAAQARGWLPPLPPYSKTRIRDHLRTLPGGDLNWQRLQGEVYGPRMGEAVPMPGVAAFLAHCRRQKIACVVVSHKTRRASLDPTGTDLRAVARRWLADRRLLDSDLSPLRPEHIWFEDSRAAKIDRLARLGCSHFIDDLPEVFREENFPRQTHAWLYDPEGGAALDPGWRRFCSWGAIERAVFSEISG